MSSDAQVLYTTFAIIAVLAVAVSTHRIADANALQPIPLWSWTGGATLAAVIDVGLVYGGMLDLTSGAPSGTRIGWTVCGLIAAVLGSALVFDLTRGTASAPTPRWTRWRLAGAFFSGVVAVGGVICAFLN